MSRKRKMSSEVEPSSDSDIETSGVSDESSGSKESTDEDYNVVCSGYAPYQDEPLAEDGEGSEDERGADNEGEEADEDGLTPRVLEARYDRTVAVNSWLVALFHVFVFQSTFHDLFDRNT